MTYDNVKSQVNKLFPLYVTGKQEYKEKCIDQLFILVYYNPRYFSITMKEEVLNDFRATLYPKVIENIFSKYDENKSSFFSFVCLCLKTQANAFLRKIYLKEALDETILKEVTNDENDKFIDEGNSTLQNSNSGANDTSNFNIEYEESNMKKELSVWLSETTSLQSKKNYKRAIFILSCKIAYLIDDGMLQMIAKYIGMPQDLLRYYIAKLNLQYSISSRAKKIMEAKNQRDKYFVKKNATEALLMMENLSETGKSTLMCSKEYSIQKYKNACEKLESQRRAISNRTIAQITGISRSMIDRIITNILDILKYSPAIDGEADAF